jgi:hypothetical protein
MTEFIVYGGVPGAGGSSLLAGAPAPFEGKVVGVTNTNGQPVLVVADRLSGLMLTVVPEEVIRWDEV